MRSPGAPSDSGMQRVPFCLKEPKCNLLAPAGNSENWANMLSWHSARNKNIQRRDFMLLQPRNSSSKVLGGDKGLLKPENLREKYASQDPGRARLHEQRQCDPEKAEAHTWPLPTRARWRHKLASLGFWSWSASSPWLFEKRLSGLRFLKHWH